MVEESARSKEDLDAHFKETVTRAVTKLEVKEEIEKPTMDDENKTFRTRLVAFWMLSNAVLAISVANLNGLSSGNESVDEDALRKKQNIYFAVILYSTFGLAAVRFIGVCLHPSLMVVPLAHFAHSACTTSSSVTCSGAAGGISLRCCEGCCIWDTLGTDCCRSFIILYCCISGLRTFGCCRPFITTSPVSLHVCLLLFRRNHGVGIFIPVLCTS